MYGKRKNNIRSYDKRAHKVLFICALVFCIVSVSLVACCFNESQKIVYADYETDILNNSSAIVNFNQIIPNEYINHTFSYVGLNTISNTTIIGSHKYYIKLKNNSSETFDLLFGDDWSNFRIALSVNANSESDNIFTYGQDLNGIACYPNEANTKIENLNIIDLTKMFGSNEPNINQCRDLFTADYYNYTTGQAVSISGLNSFIEGVNYAYEQLNFDVVNSSAYTTAFIDPTLNNSNAFVERYVDMGTNGQYLYLKARGYLSIPLSQTLDQGSILNFGYTDPGQGGSGNYLYIGILYNSNFIPVMNISTHLTDDRTTDLTMTIPYSTNTIIFVESSTEDYFTFVDSAYWLGDLQVNYAQLDVQVLINSIVSDELRKQKEFYDGYYSYGEGYTRIYNQGLQDGSATGQAFTDSMTFTGSVFHAIGDILSMQVIPNIPLGLFVALPLLVGLLFFIVKIAKGSGG